MKDFLANLTMCHVLSSSYKKVMLMFNLYVLSGSVMVLFWVTGEQTEIDTILATVESDVTSGLTLTFPGGSSQTFSQYLEVDSAVILNEVKY